MTEKKKNADLDRAIILTIIIRRAIIQVVSIMH